MTSTAVVTSIKFILLFFSSSLLDVAVWAADLSPNTPERKGEQCSAAYAGPKESSFASELHAFVTAQKRLPVASIKEEKLLYQKLYDVTARGLLKGHALSAETVTLVRREVFYRNHFLELITRLRSTVHLSAREQRRIVLHQLWGDDPDPDVGPINFVSLILAQADRVLPWNGKHLLAEADEFVRTYSRLPTHSDHRSLKYQLDKAVTETSPVLLQLGRSTRELLRETPAYKRSKTAFDLERRRTERPSADLEWRAAIWRLFSQDSD